MAAAAISPRGREVARDLVGLLTALGAVVVVVVVVVVVGALVDTSEVSVDDAIRSRLASVTGCSDSSGVDEGTLCFEAPATADESESSSLAEPPS